MSWLSNFLRGGAEELGWDDLIRRVVVEIAGLKRFGPRGEARLPEQVVVRITVSEGGVSVVKGFVDRPELDREVAARLANRCDLPVERLPVREYVVSSADRTTVTAIEAPPRRWALLIDGGDLSGTRLRLPAAWSEVAFGRSEWHGPDQSARNDLVVCEHTAFVSRRAGRLYRTGRQVEVVALDQGDALLVRHADGTSVRPARTARGRATVDAGDAIELSDEHGETVRLLLQPVAE